MCGKISRILTFLHVELTPRWIRSLACKLDNCFLNVSFSCDLKIASAFTNNYVYSCTVETFL